MLRVGWFNEFSPWDQIIFDTILEITQKNYKQFWYTHISTPAVERNDVLLAKSWEDASKQIFWLYGLAQWSEDTKDYSLHYDLTVPFARYVLDWQAQLTFPFKRYQIQPVWRGERQQRWRFKEFYQADIDVIWKWDDTNTYLYYDAETIFVLYKTLLDIKNTLWINENIIVNISNRKILGPLVDYISDNVDIKQVDSVIEWEPVKTKTYIRDQIFSLVDRYYKIWQDQFRAGLVKLLEDENYVNLLMNFLLKELTIDNLLTLKWYIPSQEFDSWIDELYQVLSYLDHLWKWLGIDHLYYQINFFIVRWLDYYTGTVFETYFQKNTSLGSICSWWRYEGLTTHIDPKTNYSWVGGSIWVDRLLSILETTNPKSTIADYMFMNFDETKSQIFELAWKYIAQWNNIEIYPSNDKFKKQLQYADKKGIRYVIILWESESQTWIYKLKDLQTGEEKEFKL